MLCSKLAQHHIQGIFADHLKQFFCEIYKSKFSFFLNFCFQGNQEVSIHTSSLTICLYLTPKSVVHLNSILVTSPQWGSLQYSPIPPSCWSYSINFCWSLLERHFEPWHNFVMNPLPEIRGLETLEVLYFHGAQFFWNFSGVLSFRGWPIWSISYKQLTFYFLLFMYQIFDTNFIFCQKFLFFLWYLFLCNCPEV